MTTESYGQCGCGEPIARWGDNGTWQHLRRILDLNHVAAEQLKLIEDNHHQEDH